MKGAFQKGGDRPFRKACWDKTRGDGFKLCFLLGLGKPGPEYKAPNSLAISVIMLHCLPGVAEVFP